jgi:hypothetical protein
MTQFISKHHVRKSLESLVGLGNGDGKAAKYNSTPVTVATMPEPPPFVASYKSAYEWQIALCTKYLRDVIELPEYEDAFRSKGIEGVKFLCLDERKLKSLMVVNSIHRKKILSHTMQLRQKMFESNSLRHAPHDMRQWNAVHLSAWLSLSVDAPNAARCTLRDDLGYEQIMSMDEEDIRGAFADVDEDEVNTALAAIYEKAASFAKPVDAASKTKRKVKKSLGRKKTSKGSTAASSSKLTAIKKRRMNASAGEASKNIDGANPVSKLEEGSDTENETDAEVIVLPVAGQKQSESDMALQESNAPTMLGGDGDFSQAMSGLAPKHPEQRKKTKATVKKKIKKSVKSVTSSVASTTNDALQKVLVEKIQRYQSINDDHASVVKDLKALVLTLQKDKAEADERALQLQKRLSNTEESLAAAAMARAAVPEHTKSSMKKIKKKSAAQPMTSQSTALSRAMDTDAHSTTAPLHAHISEQATKEVKAEAKNFRDSLQDQKNIRDDVKNLPEVIEVTQNPTADSDSKHTEPMEKAAKAEANDIVLYAQKDTPERILTPDPKPDPFAKELDGPAESIRKQTKDFQKMHPGEDYPEMSITKSERPIEGIVNMNIEGRDAKVESLEVRERAPVVEAEAKEEMAPQPQPQPQPESILVELPYDMPAVTKAALVSGTKGHALKQLQEINSSITAMINDGPKEYDSKEVLDVYTDLMELYTHKPKIDEKDIKGSDGANNEEEGKS